MRVPIVCPDFGESDVRIGVWMASEGMAVVSGEPLLDLVLPGLVWTVTAPGDGRLVQIRRQDRAPPPPARSWVGWILSTLTHEERGVRRGSERGWRMCLGIALREVIVSAKSVDNGLRAP